MKHLGKAPPKWLARVLRIALVVVLLGALVWLDWKIATLIETQRLEDLQARVELDLDQDHELVVVTEPADVALFEPADTAVEDVEACFTGSRLGSRTRDLLEVFTGERPPQEGEIVLFTGTFDGLTLPEEETGGRCRTRIEVATAGEKADPVRLRAYRYDGCGTGGRALGLSPEGGSLQVRLSAVTPPTPEGLSARGCRKIVLVGEDWDEELPAPLGLEILVPPGGEAAFRFRGVGAEGPFVPFQFERVRSLELWHGAREEPVLHAHGLGDPGDVRLDRLALLPEGRLGLAISGAGPIEGESAYVPRVTLQEWVRLQVGAHPFLSLLVGGLNGLLAGLLVTYLVKKPLASAWQWLRSRFGRPTSDPEAEAPRDPDSRSLSPPPAREPPRREASLPPPGRRSSESRRP